MICGFVPYHYQVNTWRVIYHYTDCNGEQKQSQKRGFATKREAQLWEREQLNKMSSDLDMTFKSFADLILNGNPEAYSKAVTEYISLD